MALRGLDAEYTSVTVDGIALASADANAGAAANAAPIYFNNRKASIYGGSNEIQRNIIAERILGLPKDGSD